MARINPRNYNELSCFVQAENTVGCTGGHDDLFAVWAVAYFKGSAWIQLVPRAIINWLRTVPRLSALST